MITIDSNMSRTSKKTSYFCGLGKFFKSKRHPQAKGKANTSTMPMATAKKHQTRSLSALRIKTPTKRNHEDSKEVEAIIDHEKTAKKVNLSNETTGDLAYTNPESDTNSETCELLGNTTGRSPKETLENTILDEDFGPKVTLNFSFEGFNGEEKENIDCENAVAMEELEEVTDCVALISITADSSVIGSEVSNVRSDSTSQEPIKEEELCVSVTTPQEPIKEKECVSDTTSQEPIKEKENVSDTSSQEPIKEEDQLYVPVTNTQGLIKEEKCESVTKLQEPIKEEQLCVPVTTPQEPIKDEQCESVINPQEPSEEDEFVPITNTQGLIKEGEYESVANPKESIKEEEHVSVTEPVLNTPESGQPKTKSIFKMPGLPMSTNKSAKTPNPYKLRSKSASMVTENIFHVKSEPVSKLVMNTPNPHRQRSESIFDGHSYRWVELRSLINAFETLHGCTAGCMMVCSEKDLQYGSSSVIRIECTDCKEKVFLQMFGKERR